MDNPTTEDTTVPTTDTPISEVPSAAEPSVPAGESVAAGSTSADTPATPNGQPIEYATSFGGSAGEQGNALLASGDSKQGEEGDGSTFTEHTGTLADITQVGDHTVVTDISQTGNQLAGSGNVLVNETPTLEAPVLEGDTVTVTNVENDLNPLVPPAGTEGAPASQIAAAQAEGEVEPLPRESHLLLLEHKFAIAFNKLRNAERLALDELEAIYAHVKAVI